MSNDKISNSMHSERQLVSGFNSKCLSIKLFCIKKTFFCKLEVGQQPPQDDWEQFGLQVNIDLFTLTDIKNKEDSGKQMKCLLAL